jgi:hypothetical protein
MDGEHNTLVEDLLALTGDIDSLRRAFRDRGSDRATVLRMCAGKAEHVADLMRHMADGLEHGWYECG